MWIPTVACYCKKICALLFLILLSGCVKKYTPWQPTKQTPLQFFKQVQNVCANRYQVKGSYTLKLTGGVKQFLGSAEADIIAQTPSKFYFSMRSILNTPAKLFISDGKAYKFMETKTIGKNIVKEGRVDSKSIADVLSLTIWPHEMVSFLLGCIPLDYLDGAKVLSAQQSSNELDYKIRLISKDKRNIELIASKNAIHKISFFNSKNELSFYVKFLHYKNIGKIYFPHSLEFYSSNKNIENFTMTANDIDINGKKVAQDVFKKSLL